MRKLVHLIHAALIVYRAVSDLSVDLNAHLRIAPLHMLAIPLVVGQRLGQIDLLAYDRISKLLLLAVIQVPV